MRTIFSFAAAILGAGVCCAQTQPVAANAIVLAESGYQVPSSSLGVAPGQVLVLHVHGVATVIPSNLAPVPTSSGYPHVLDGVSVDLIQGKSGTATSLELRAIYQTNCIAPCSPVTGITLQIPFEIETDFGAKGDPFPWLRISENGKPVGGVSVTPVSDNVHVLNTCDDSQTYISAAVSVPQNICAAVVMGGTAVAINSLYNLAHGGDETGSLVIRHGGYHATAD
jgi:hypothetical protein